MTQSSPPGGYDPVEPGMSSSASLLSRAAAPAALTRGSLEGERGSTRIADTVVAKIAGYAAREIPGVQALGAGSSHTLGAQRGPRQPGGGVSVEVGERQAAIDLDLVTSYGQSIVEITEAVRANVIDRIESMTGLEVTEVNITVDDLHVEGVDDERSGEEPRRP